MLRAHISIGKYALEKTILHKGFRRHRNNLFSVSSFSVTLSEEKPEFRHSKIYTVYKKLIRDFFSGLSFEEEGEDSAVAEVGLAEPLGKGPGGGVVVFDDGADVIRDAVFHHHE